MLRYVYFGLLTIAIYIYIHNPFIKFLGGFGSIAYLFPLIILLITDKESKKLLSNNRDIIIFSLTILFFCLGRYLIGGEFGALKNSFYHLVTADILTIPLVILIIKSHFELKKILIINCALASTITMACVLIPQVDSTVKGMLVETSEILDSGIISFRGFGFANGLLYNYGISLGIILSYCVYKGYLSKWWFYLLLILAFFAIMVNARTGFIVFASVLLLYMIFNPRKGMLLFILGSILLTILVPIIGLSFLDDRTALFIEEFFDSIFAFFTSGDAEQGGTFEHFDRMLIFPDTIDGWIYGYGINIYGGFKINSDIGFIQQLFYGGLIYIALLMLMVVKLLKRVKNKYWLIASLSIIIISNFKGDFISTSGGFRLLYLIIIYEYWNNYKTREFFCEPNR